MSYDGRALSRARETIRRNKQNNETELRRRRVQAFSREPELESLEVEMTRVMTELSLSALKRGENAGEAVREARDKSVNIIRRRSELLRKCNLPEEFLDEIYSCEKCCDTGYIKGEMCSCLEAAYRQEASKLLTSVLNLGNQSFENFDISLYELENDAIGTNRIRSAMAEIRTMCEDYALDFGQTSVNLLFRGSTGLGKTFLSACIAKAVSEKGFSVVYDTCVSVIDAYETQKFDRNADNGAETSSQIKRYLNCDLLILDDLGTEMTTAFTQSALYSLINTRLLSGKQTIISTNLSEDELSKRYSPQLASRIKGEFEALQFLGRDIRAVKKER